MWRFVYIVNWVKEMVTASLLTLFQGGTNVVPSIFFAALFRKTSWLRDPCNVGKEMFFRCYRFLRRDCHLLLVEQKGIAFLILTFKR